MNLSTLANSPAESAFAQWIGLNLERERVIFCHDRIMERQRRHR